MDRFEQFKKQLDAFVENNKDDIMKSLESNNPSTTEGFNNVIASNFLQEDFIIRYTTRDISDYIDSKTTKFVNYDEDDLEQIMEEVKEADIDYGIDNIYAIFDECIENFFIRIGLSDDEDNDEDDDE